MNALNKIATSDVLLHGALHFVFFFVLAVGQRTASSPSFCSRGMGALACRMGMMRVQLHKVYSLCVFVNGVDPSHNISVGPTSASTSRV